jgi:hypothetical protein
MRKEIGRKKSFYFKEEKIFTFVFIIKESKSITFTIVFGNWKY